MEELKKILNVLVNLFKEQVIQLKSANDLLKENNAILYKVLENQKSDRMTQKQYAECTGISINTLIRRVREGKYDTPEGFEEPAYLLAGNQDSPIFYCRLADKYYHINSTENKLLKIYENANQVV